MVESETIYSLLRNRSKTTHLTLDEVRTGIQLIRGQNEEAYKIFISPMISSLLTQMVLQCNKLPASKIKDSNVIAFDAPSVPEISVADYLDRIVKYTPCSAECYLLALLFIDRVILAKNLRLSLINVHRVLFTSILVSAKLLDDSTYNNKYYSIVGGIELKELNALERKFLTLLNYNLNVSPETFEYYRVEVEIQVLLNEQAYEDEAPAAAAPSTLQRTASEAKTCSVETKENSRLLAKQLRRSRSFNTVTEGRLFNWRKRRSSSFNVVILV